MSGAPELEMIEWVRNDARLVTWKLECECEWKEGGAVNT